MITAHKFTLFHFPLSDTSSPNEESVIAPKNQIVTAGSEGVAETETTAQQQPRRSSRLNKKQQHGPANTATTNRNGTADVFSNMDLKTCQLEGHHHDICSVDMHGKYIVSVGYDCNCFVFLPKLKISEFSIAQISIHTQNLP